MLGDRIDMGIASGAISTNCILRRRNDQLDIRTKYPRDCRGGWTTVIGPVCDEAANRSGNISQQIGQSAGIADMLGCQMRRDEIAALRIEADVEFAPCFSSLRQPVLLPHPLAAAMHTQPSAIHDQRDRAIGCAGVRHDLERWRAPVERRVIRHGKLQLHEPQKTAHKTLTLPKRQAEHSAQDQADLDRQIRVSLLTAPLPGMRSAPPRYRIPTEPDRHIPALTKCFVVLGPIVTRYFALANLLRRPALNLNGIQASRSQIIPPATLQKRFM